MVFFNVFCKIPKGALHDPKAKLATVNATRKAPGDENQVWGFKGAYQSAADDSCIQANDVKRSFVCLTMLMVNLRRRYA